MRTTYVYPVALVALLGPLSVAASTSESPVVRALNPRVAQVVNAAQTAIKERHWREAEKILDDSTAEADTDWEHYRLEELKAYVLYRERKVGAAAAMYAQLLRSPNLSARERKIRAKSVAEMYFRAGDYRQAASYGKSYLDAYADDPTVAALLADSQLRLKQYAQSAAAMTSAIDRAEAEHKAPEEGWLRIADNAYYRMGDTRGEISILQKLVHYYHRGEDWRALIALSSRGQSDERVQFEYLRLKYDLGMLDDPDEYESLVFESMEEGMPTKAVAVLTQAKERGVFTKDRYERMHHAIDYHDVGEQERLHHAINRAQGDDTGENDALLARIYLDQGAYARAAAAAQRAIDKGTLVDQNVVRLNLGIAYLRNGQLRLAEDAFDAVSSNPQWGPLAQLWKLHAEDLGSQPKVTNAHDVS
jgi:predicted Zn-dependent protease